MELESHLVTIDAQKRDTVLHQAAHEMEHYLIFDGIPKRIATKQQANEVILRFSGKPEMKTNYAAWRLGTPTPYSMARVAEAGVAKLLLPKQVAFPECNLENKSSFQY